VKRKLYGMKKGDIKLRTSMEETINKYVHFISSALLYNGCRHKTRMKIEEKSYKKGHYPCIPSHGIISLLIDLINVMEKLRNSLENQHYMPKFLDAGCGIGNVVLLARNVGCVATGIEYDLRTYRLAKKLIDSDSYYPNGTIIKGDITTFDKYGDYDIIYYYQPMNKSELMNQFLEKLSNDMKIGAYIISYGSQPPSILNRNSNGSKIIRIHNTTFNTIYKKVRQTNTKKKK